MLLLTLIVIKSILIYGNPMNEISPSLSTILFRGGFALPDLKVYYEACNLIWIRDWIQLKNKKILNLEGFDLCLGWHAYLWKERVPKEKNFGNNFFRSALIKTWDKYRKRMYNKTPRWFSPLEASQRRLLGWEEWPCYEKIIKKSGKNYELKSLQEIKTIYKNMTWLQYYQFKTDKDLGFMEKDNLWDKILFSERKTITKIYKVLLEWNTETELIKNSMSKWARCVGRPILLEEWESCWNRKLKYTYSYNLKENWMKMLYRWHFTPKKLGKINKTANTKCWKCGEEEGSFYHMWWNCQRAKEYWKKIHESAQLIVGVKFQKLPEIYLLNIFKLPPGSNEEKILTFLSTAARIVYARYWKQDKIPTTEEWLVKILEIKNMDKLTFLIAKQQGRPRKETDWRQLEKYLKSKKIN
uniref:Reverse transcriptase zinc-binding domain-containing protein n=1 Tax=Anolis carolinensis TaxID=28377 RepID=A0A803TFM9_ANOCA